MKQMDNDNFILEFPKSSLIKDVETLLFENGWKKEKEYFINLMYPELKLECKSWRYADQIEVHLLIETKTYEITLKYHFTQLRDVSRFLYENFSNRRLFSTPTEKEVYRDVYNLFFLGGWELLQKDDVRLYFKHKVTNKDCYCTISSNYIHGILYHDLSDSSKDTPFECFSLPELSTLLINATKNTNSKSEQNSLR